MPGQEVGIGPGLDDVAPLKAKLAERGAPLVEEFACVRIEKRGPVVIEAPF